MVLKLGNTNPISYGLQNTDTARIITATQTPELRDQLEQDIAKVIQNSTGTTQDKALVFAKKMLNAIKNADSPLEFSEVEGRVRDDFSKLKNLNLKVKLQRTFKDSSRRSH